MATLFSYVVDHDLGFAPNPNGGFCTLVHCKYESTSGRRNVVELANVGDWILGTGGSSRLSAGHGRLIYLMRVDENAPFKHFLRDSRFQGRSDCKDFGESNRRALISRRYFYFGKNALPIADLPSEFAVKELVKRGVGFRRDYPHDLLRRFVQWVGENYEIGMHGDPCGSHNRSIKVRRRSRC